MTASLAAVQEIYTDAAFVAVFISTKWNFQMKGGTIIVLKTFLGGKDVLLPITGFGQIFVAAVNETVMHI